jgi:cytochrome bd ubiquinol oxidase subunit II
MTPTLTLGLDFVLIWTLILGVGVFIYVLLDGFDLGVGILFGFAPNTAARNVVMNSIAPVWDGNETWLILGSMGLLAAFPIAFAIIIPAVYFPISLMLLSLIFRGVAFEFRYRDSGHRGFWDRGFNYGSLLATFMQGIVLGAFVQGFTTDGTVFTGSSLDCFTPFSILVGICLVFGYALLGAGWLVLKTQGEIQSWARALGRKAFLGVCAAILLVSIWTTVAFPDIRSRWFSWPDVALLTPVPIVTAAVAWLELRSLNRTDSEAGPFIGAITLFALSYLGIGISLFPYVVPHRLTLWQAASNPSTQVFLLIGTLFLLPVILMYTGWSYWVFRGKVRADIGYQ